MKTAFGFFLLLFFFGCAQEEVSVMKKAAGQYSSSEQLVYEYLQQKAEQYPFAGDSSQLDLFQEEQDHLGLVHLKFQQIFHSVPVWQKELYAHINKEGVVYRVDENLVRIAESFSVQPRLSEEEISALYFQNYDMAQEWQIVEVTLVIFVGEDLSPNLAYQIELEKDRTGRIVILAAGNGSKLDAVRMVYIQ